MPAISDPSCTQAAALGHACSFDAAVRDALSPRQYASWLLFAWGGGCSRIWLIAELLAAQEHAARAGAAAAAAEFPHMAAAFAADACSPDSTVAGAADAWHLEAPPVTGGMLPVDPLLGELSTAGLLDPGAPASLITLAPGQTAMRGTHAAAEGEA